MDTNITGAELRAIRKTLGLSKGEAQTLLNINSHVAINRMEKGKVAIRPQFFNELKAIYVDSFSQSKFEPKRNESVEYYFIFEDEFSFIKYASPEVQDGYVHFISYELYLHRLFLASDSGIRLVRFIPDSYEIFLQDASIEHSNMNLTKFLEVTFAKTPTFHEKFTTKPE